MTKVLFTVLIVAGMSAAAQTNLFPSSGNVRINTSNSDGNLTLNGTLLMSGSAANLDPAFSNTGFNNLANSGKLLVGWNRHAGQGETDFISNRGGGGTGGFSFFDYSNSGTLTNLMKISGDGKVSLGNTNPTEKLDISGNLYLRNMTNTVGGGSSISFSAYDDVHLGPKIRSYLDYANGASSISRLVLSSYYGGYPNEITLVGGKVGIKTMNPTEELSVNGNIRSKEVKVETANWPDFVFEKSYKLPSLQETAIFIKKNGHLPDIPTAAEIEKNGQKLGELNAKLLQKIEELTLHLIEKDQELQAEKTRNDRQQEQLIRVIAKVAKLEKRHR